MKKYSRLKIMNEYILRIISIIYDADIKIAKHVFLTSVKLRLLYAGRP